MAAMTKSLPIRGRSLASLRDRHNMVDGQTIRGPALVAPKAIPLEDFAPDARQEVSSRPGSSRAVLQPVRMVFTDPKSKEAGPHELGNALPTVGGVDADRLTASTCAPMLALMLAHPCRDIGRDGVGNLHRVAPLERRKSASAMLPRRNERLPTPACAEVLATVLLDPPVEAGLGLMSRQKPRNAIASMFKLDRDRTAASAAAPMLVELHSTAAGHDFGSETVVRHRLSRDHCPPPAPRSAVS